MAKNIAPTDFRPFAAFRRTGVQAGQLNNVRPWVTPDAPNWVQQADLGRIDDYFHGWDLAACAKNTVRHGAIPALPDGDAARLVEVVTVHCLPDFRYCWTFRDIQNVLPFTDRTVREFATLVYDSRYALLPSGLGLGSVARFMAEALLIAAHNGAVPVIDEAGPGCHVFNEADPGDWTLLWQSDRVVAEFFWLFQANMLQTTLVSLKGRGRGQALGHARHQPPFRDEKL